MISLTPGWEISANTAVGVELGCPGPPGDAPAANPCACCAVACRRSSTSPQATLTATPRGPGDPPPNQNHPAQPTHATGPMRRGFKRCPEHHAFAFDASGLDQAPPPPHARRPAPTRAIPKIRPRRSPGQAIRRRPRRSRGRLHRIYLQWPATRRAALPRACPTNG